MTGQNPMTVILPRHQWSANEYLRIVEAGLFNKIELLQGDIVVTGAACKPDPWTLEVYRHPVPDPRSFSAWRYQDGRVLQPGEQVSPLAAPEIVVPVAAVLPA